VLHNFNKEGGVPYSPLSIDGKGALYGTTIDDFRKKGCGSVFRLKSPPQQGKHWVFSQLHLFQQGTLDGCTPVGGLIAAPGGTLYGTTVSGGEFNAGTVFAVTPPAAGSKTCLLVFFQAAPSSAPSSVTR